MKLRYVFYSICFCVACGGSEAARNASFARIQVAEQNLAVALAADRCEEVRNAAETVCSEADDEDRRLRCRAAQAQAAGCVSRLVDVNARP